MDATMDPRAAAALARRGNLRRRAWPALALALGALAAGCGTSHVSMVVTRPALLNARAFGGSASVAGFDAAHPGLIGVAEPLRVAVEQAILHAGTGAVQLVAAGGGLSISGRVDEHGLHLETEKERTTCTRTVRVQQGGREVEQRSQQPCDRYRVRWRARMAVLTRVTSSAGQVLFYRHVVEEDTGVTSWRDEELPTVQDAEARLAKLRQRTAEAIAWVVTPHKERVTATLYDCPAPATATCNAAIRMLAASNYEGALATYGQALQQLQSAPKGTPSVLAEVHWNRAIVARYGRMFSVAVEALRAAIALDNSASYRAELDEVLKAAQEHERLIDQGLGGQAAPADQGSSNAAPPASAAPPSAGPSRPGR